MNRINRYYRMPRFRSENTSIPISITYPTAETVLFTNGEATLSWLGNCRYVIIEFSDDDGSTWETVESKLRNNNEYSWLVPETASDMCLIKITNYSNPLDTDTSESFEIIIPLTITAPVEDEKVYSGKEYEVTLTGSCAAFSLYYSLNGADFILVEAAILNTGSYNWDVPAITDEEVFIKAVSDDNENDYDLISVSMTETVLVISPNGGETWKVGEKHDITWTGNSALVKLHYRIGIEDPVLIADDVPNTGSYEWTIPDAPSNAVVVIVTNHDDPTDTDQSDATFTIATAMPELLVDGYTTDGSSNFIDRGIGDDFIKHGSAHMDIAASHDGGRATKLPTINRYYNTQWYRGSKSEKRPKTVMMKCQRTDQQGAFVSIGDRSGNGGWILVFYNSYCGFRWGNVVCETAVTTTADTWYIIVGKQDGLNLTVEIYDNTKTLLATESALIDSFQVSSHSLSVSPFFDGGSYCVFEHVAIFIDHVLTEDEVKAIIDYWNTAD